MSFCSYIVTDKKAIYRIQLYPNYQLIHICRGKHAASEFMKYAITIVILIGNLIDTAIIPLSPLTKEENKTI